MRPSSPSGSARPSRPTRSPSSPAHNPERWRRPSLLDDDRLRFLTAHLDGHVVSAAVSFVDHGVGSLAFGATLPTARRRGSWQQLAVARIRTMPDLWVTGVFSDFSRPGAERLGFVPIQRFTLWVRRSPARTDHDPDSREEPK